MLQKAKQNWKKTTSSVIVISFFLFFWINGPINQSIESHSVENHTSEFGIPKLIGKRPEIKDVGILSSTKKGDKTTNGLLINREHTIAHSGIIHAKPTKEKLNKHAGELLEHASELLKIPASELTVDNNYVLSEHNIYFESSPWLDHIVGYAGPITVGLVLDLNNKVEDAFIISSHETESYLRKIQKAGYYQQYAGLVFDKGHKKIDGVSGATISSQTIGTIVENMVQQAVIDQPNYASTGNHVFSLDVKNTLLWILHISLILILFLYGYQSKVKKTKRHMVILSIFSVIYIGFFLNNSFTYISFIEPFVGTTVSAFTGIYAFASLMAAVWGNNIYCKYVCPFGHVQRLTVKIPFIKQRKLPISNAWLERVRNTLTLVLIAGILLGLRQWKNYEVFPLLFGANVFSIGFAIAFLVLIVSTIYPMFWCRVACPTGCVLDTVKKLSK